MPTIEASYILQVSTCFRRGDVWMSQIPIYTRVEINRNDNDKELYRKDVYYRGLIKCLRAVTLPKTSLVLIGAPTAAMTALVVDAIGCAYDVVAVYDQSDRKYVTIKSRSPSWYPLGTDFDPHSLDGRGDASVYPVEPIFQTK